MEIKYTEQELNSIDKTLLIKMFLNLQNQMETLTVEMDAKKALIRAEDMKKGVFSTVGQLPIIEGAIDGALKMEQTAKQKEDA
jgi:hypothetical protein